jgi:hypothetical protein
VAAGKPPSDFMKGVRVAGCRPPTPPGGRGDAAAYGEGKRSLVAFAFGIQSSPDRGKLGSWRTGKPPSGFTPVVTARERCEHLPSGESGWRIAAYGLRMT